MEPKFYDGIAAICAQYSGNGFYVGRGIPARKLANAAESMNIAEGEQVIAFVDCTVFGSGKNGLAICTSGLYWHNDWTTPTATNYLSWEAFRSVGIGFIEKYKLVLGWENHLNTAACGMKQEDLLRLLQEIQAYVREAYNAMEAAAAAPPPPVPPQTSEWYVAIDGQQYGPYGPNVLRDLVQSRQVAPETAFAWKQGMASWVPFLQVPELAALLGRPSAPPPPPPPRTAAPFAGHPGQEAAAEFAAGPVDINTASYEELVERLGMRPVDAGRIIQDREAIGGFASPEHVGERLGLKPHQVDRLRKSARFSPIPKQSGHGRMVDY